jgi:metal-responsive CopG/Arc/MetJ family transcriptional regulator
LTVGELSDIIQSNTAGYGRGEMRASKILSISVPPSLWDEIGKLAEKEQMTRSELLRVAAREYIRSRTWVDLRKKGVKTALKFGIKTESDVDRIIHEMRRK